MYWHIRPNQNVELGFPYGNIATVEDWADAERWQSYEQVGLYMVGAPGEREDWQRNFQHFLEWDDFVWSDDSYPWVTKQGRKKLERSRLTGFEFKPVVIAEIDQIDMAGNAVPFPSVYRVEVPRTFTPQDMRWDEYDYVMYIDHRRAYVLLISDRMKDWLEATGWRNYELEEFHPPGV